MSSFYKTQVITTANHVDQELSGLKRRLLPQVDGFMTCGKTCSTKSDCHGC
ncbi:hypothetical protein RND71_008640 [Anisodus tanguticus]|uniref:Uncharacterized protein n=1 Tax=Anisodus tanguticus TaxID=243964 RepID=A0AAE1VQX0_9SOLA|nr:hypothetical protein RND71_008640 [Anisodus tanguticus]